MKKEEKNARLDKINVKLVTKLEKMAGKADAEDLVEIYKSALPAQAKINEIMVDKTYENRVKRSRLSLMTPTDNKWLRISNFFCLAISDKNTKNNFEILGLSFFALMSLSFLIYSVVSVFR